ncbi:GNAT family N-acetyltransferase [Candidatus Gracilibacteria bacterium]|nr:GNAT family N-acetyltransferase [Candidatus Gracilibacteria bacterium]NJP20574.1 GNAT family N-acetyltransferase [Hydrococcus sp. CRU_1_1]
MIIRLFQEQDTEQIAQLFHDTVREINIRDYSLNRVKAWAPDNIYFRNWTKICSERLTYVADNEGAIAGFCELELSGHIDCFYCHRNFQRMGVGSQIYSVIEAKASQLGINRLYTEASITAKPFFLHKGFSIIKEQQVECRGETLTNYTMEKILKTTNN